MDRRDFVGVLAAAAVPGGEAATAAAAAAASLTDEGRGSPATGAGEGAGFGPDWVGARALAGGKGYAPGKLGQIHYRMLGEGGGTPFLLIHQTPIGFSEYVDVQPALAAAGRRSVAMDNPGYGFSDPAPGPVTVGDLADHLVPLCDQLRLSRVIVAGHHTGAAIAAAFAARHPGRTAGVVLHGTPLYDEGERATRLARLASTATPLKPDGSHLSDLFMAIGKHAGIDAQSLAGLTWATIGSLLAGPTSPVYRAVFSNDMSADLRAIRAPTLVLTDTHDVLHPNDQRVVGLRPDFTLRQFSQGRSFALMREPRRWAQVLLEFAAAQQL
jgi:pimeloyl-ACP methyl ester carboxylesterase